MNVQILDLNKAQREELYNLHATSVAPTSIAKLFYEIQVPVKTIDLRAIDSSNLHKMKSDEMERYVKLLDDKATKYPVISGDSLIDGGRRISAAIHQGKTKMEVLDFGVLFRPHVTGEQYKVKVIPEKKQQLAM